MATEHWTSNQSENFNISSNLFRNHCLANWMKGTTFWVETIYVLGVLLQFGFRSLSLSLSVILHMLHAPCIARNALLSSKKKKKNHISNEIFFCVWYIIFEYNKVDCTDILYPQSAFKALSFIVRIVHLSFTHTHTYVSRIPIRLVLLSPQKELKHFPVCCHCARLMLFFLSTSSSYCVS